jgi:CheY-like chemotaxis protein
MKLAGAMGVGQKWLSVYQTPLPFVLVAEDEELVRLYAADLPTEAGYKVIDVANAETPLEAMAEQPNND